MLTFRAQPGITCFTWYIIAMVYCYVTVAGDPVYHTHNTHSPIEPSPDKFVAFTTFTFLKPKRDPYVKKEMMMTRQWVNSLKAHGIVPVIFGTGTAANHTCQILVDAGFECNSGFKIDKPVGSKRDLGGVFSVNAKYIIALDFLRQGFTVMFSDNDVVFSRNPLLDGSFTHMIENDHDIYGLSDTKGISDKDTSVQNGRKMAKGCGLEYGWPCQSTGIWIARPTLRAITFLKNFIQLLWKTTLREQKLFNLFVKAHHSEIKYGLFSKRAYANIGVARQTCATDLAVGSELVAVHMGYVHGHRKLDQCIALGKCMRGTKRTFCDCLSRNKKK